MHFSSLETPWGKPFTSKRYIHPPFAESIVTMWPNSMILFGENPATDSQGWFDDPDLGTWWTCPTPSSGLIFTVKREDDSHFRCGGYGPQPSFDWNHGFMPAAGTDYHARKDGLPIHAFTKDLDGLLFSEEAFCDDKRVPTAYVRITVRNGFAIRAQAELCLLAAAGHETLFTGCPEPDGYFEYKPSRELWNKLSRFHLKDGVLTDGNYRIVSDDLSLFTETEEGCVLSMSLGPNEERAFSFAMTRSAQAPLPYETAKQNATDFWQGQLNRAKNSPDLRRVDPVFNNLLAQMLQMFSCPIGADYTVLRQGGTQRYDWPEAKEVVRALSYIGGYEDFLAKELSYYFDVLQEKDGENAGRIFSPQVPWITRSAAGLEMFCYITSDSKSLFGKYLEPAMMAFRWMERQRKLSAAMPGVEPGIFPPGIASDSHESTSQQWTTADTAMLRGYRCFMDVLDHYGHPYLKEVTDAYNDYMGNMQRIFRRFADAQKDSNFLYVPMDPKDQPGDKGDWKKDWFFYSKQFDLLAMGVAGYGTKEAEKVLMTYTYGGQKSHGLATPAHRSSTGVGRTWYTTLSEMQRFEYYQRCNNRDAMEEIVNAILRYNVTPEYQQPERIDDHNAYVAPWMPNASANGRLIVMLFELYGSGKIH